MQHQVDNRVGKLTTVKGRHSSVDSSASSILLSRVRIPSTPFSHCIEKRNVKNKQKEAGFGPSIKKLTSARCQLKFT